MMSYNPPPGIKYADFSEKEKEKARKNHRLLFISPMLSSRCNLRCLVCYADGGKNPNNEMSLKIIKRVIKEGRELGAKTVRLAGLGEPLLYPNLFDLIDYANSLGMGVFMFTNGTLITPEIAERLYAKEVSVVSKFWSTDLSVFEELTGRRGFFASEHWLDYKGFLVPKGLYYLLQAGFGSDNKQPKQPTRLGVELLMHRQNQDSIIPIYRWCRQNNILPYLELIMHSGRSHEEIGKQEHSLNKEEAQGWFLKLLNLDQEEFGISWFPLAPYVGWPCDKLFYNLCVLPNGDVLPCYAVYPALGNIYSQSLESIIENPLLVKLRAGKQFLQGKCQTCSISKCKIGGCRCDACAHGNIFGEYEMCWY